MSDSCEPKRRIDVIQMILIPKAEATTLIRQNTLLESELPM